MEEALIDLLFRMADDELILGHRNTEWTGIGPVLEEDIAFSSMAQDKIGHAQANYKILHEEFGEDNPDQLAYFRKASDFKCCHFVEIPNDEYDFSIIRQFLFDNAELIRYKMFSDSDFDPVAQLARKIHGELKYHVLHGDTWVKQLGQGSEESHARLQKALNEAFPLALGIFEPGVDEDLLQEENFFHGEEALKNQWLGTIEPKLEKAGLDMPDPAESEAAYGGRKGEHTEFLQPLLDETSEVIRMDPEAEW